MSKKLNITIVRGDSYSALLTVTDYLGNIQDITGYNFFFTAKTSNRDELDDSSAVIEQSWSSHTNPESGITTLTLSATDTRIASGTYVYDIQMVSSTDIVTTLYYGNLTIAREVTVKVL